MIRVLNLWQKNEVFASEVIQPLFDLANPNSDLSKQIEEQASKTGTGLQKAGGLNTKQGRGTIHVASMANMSGLSQVNQLLTGDTQVGTIFSKLLAPLIREVGRQVSIKDKND